MTSPSNLRSQIEPVLAVLFDAAAPEGWRKCIVTPSSQARKFIPWEKLIAQPVRLSRGPAVKLVSRRGGTESTATLSYAQWADRLNEAIEAGPCHLDVLARDHDWHARRARDGRWLVTRSKPSLAQPPSAPEASFAHDRSRRHPLPPNNERVRRLFFELGIYSKSGQLLGDASAKHRQVQHYIELLRHLSVWDQQEVRIVDAGCGKAYLSLALCLWAELNGIAVTLVGVDSSPEVIETVRGIAERTGLDRSTFEASTVADFVTAAAEPVDVLLSLHACDTATDEALAAGVRLGAKAIVLVPCCHQELSDQIEKSGKAGTLPAKAAWGPTLKSGLLQHRLADIITDSLRAAALEALGYQVDVVEFVSPEATARNLMIRALKRPEARAELSGGAFERYTALASEWAVRPALEGLLGALWPPVSLPRAPH